MNVIIHSSWTTTDKIRKDELDTSDRKEKVQIILREKNLFSKIRALLFILLKHAFHILQIYFTKAINFQEGRWLHIKIKVEVKESFVQNSVCIEVLHENL